MGIISKRSNLINTVFIFFDGDKIGDRIEALLLDGQLNEAGILSDKIEKAFHDLKMAIERLPSTHIWLYGGDDLIVEIPTASVMLQDLEKLRLEYKQKCDVSISAGAGTTIQQALENLRRAKVSGRDKIVGLI